MPPGPSKPWRPAKWPSEGPWAGPPSKGHLAAVAPKTATFREAVEGRAGPWVSGEVATSCGGGTPMLMIEQERVYWHVPLSSPIVSLVMSARLALSMWMLRLASCTQMPIWLSPCCKTPSSWLKSYPTKPRLIDAASHTWTYHIAGKRMMELPSCMGRDGDGLRRRRT